MPRLLLAVLLLFGCGGSVEIPLELQPSDVAILGAKIDGRFTVQVVPHRAGERITIDADDGEPVYSWVLRPEDFALPSGETLPASILQQVAARLAGTAAERSSCGRCLAPSSLAPHVVNEGDACRIPPFVRGALWRPSKGGFVCSGASESAICSAGGEAEQKLIEEVRRSVQLDWPGACACTGDEQQGESLFDIEIRAISPVADPEPIVVFAQDAAGRVAGFSRDAAILWDPLAQSTTRLRIDDWPVTPRQAIALKDGSGFLVSSEEFNTGFFDAFRFDRFRLEGGGLVGPEPVASDHLARVERMRYLGDHPDLPLYLIGNVRGNLGSFVPSMFACSDRTLACQQVGLSRCRDERGLTNVRDVEILPSGIGIAVANQALYLKAPNPPPISNPHPADDWDCRQNESKTWPIRGGGTLLTRDFVSAGRAEDRLFVCAHSQTAACTADFAVVLSATVTASAGAVLDPSWEVVHRGADWSRCRDFLRVPGEPSQVRLHLSGAVLVDFDRDGNVVKQSNIGAEYGSVPGLARFEETANGWALLQSNESQVFLREPGGDLTQVYGGPDRALATYRAAVAIGEGDFLVFGHPEGLVRVRVLESSGGFPTSDIRVLGDPTGVLMSGDELRDAVIDSEETAATGMPVVMIAGERGGNTLLLRAVIGDTELVRGTVLPVPASVDGLGATKIGEAAEGQFVVGLEGTRLLRAVNGEVTELTIDFDDPDTDTVEARPVLPPNSCNGNQPRLDAWRSIRGRNGVAWVAGSHQLVFRVTGDRVERFFGSPTAEYSSMLLTCPDKVVFAGRGTSVDLAGLEQIQVQFWSIDPIELPAGEEVSLAIRREQALREIASDQVMSIGIYDIQEGYPRAVFPDATSGRRDPTQPPYAVVLHNGLMARFFAAEGLVSERPPFWPEVVVQSPGGYVLYGSYDSRLALGVPASKR